MADSKHFQEATSLLEEIKKEPSSVSYEHWNEALDRLTNEERGRITGELEKLAGKEKKYSLAYFEWGVAAATKEDFSKAAALFAKATEFDPQFSLAYSNQAFSLGKLNKHEDAVPLFLKAFEIDAYDANGHNSFGNTLEALKRFEDALKEYRRAAELKHDFILAYQNCTNLLINLGRIEEAIQVYEEAAKNNPNVPEIYNWWGLALEQVEANEREKNFEPAIEKFKAATEKSPEYSYAHYNWGRLLLIQGKSEEAIEKFRRTTELNPRHASAFTLWADALQKAGKFDEADATYARAAQADLSSPDAYNAWGLAMEERQKTQKEKDYEPAIEKYKAAITREGKFVYSFYNWGRLLIKQGKTEEAIEKLRQATEADPTFAGAFTLWADTLQKAGKVEEADAVYAKAVEASSSSANVYNAWGLALEERQDAQPSKNYEAAIEKFKAAIERDAKFAYSHYNWGRLLLKQGKTEEGIEKFRRATEADPAYASAFTAWADALQKEKKFEEADVIYEQATEANRDLPNAYNTWGLALEEREKTKKEKNYQPAIEKFKEAIKRENKFVYPHYNWGRLLLEEKKYEEAIERLRNAVEAEPTFVNAYMYWGKALQALGKFEEADKKYKEATETDKTQPDALNEWGLSLEERAESQGDRNYEPAIEKFREAAKRNNKFVYAHYNWGRLLLNQWRYDEAIRKFQDAIEADPTFIYSMINWGTALARQFKFDAADEQFGNALQLDPSPVFGHNSWANALLEQKRYREAIEHYQRAIELDESFAIGHFNQGLALQALQKFEEALKQFQTAIEKDPDLREAYIACADLYKTRKSYSKAINWYEKAAEKNRRSVECLMGWAEALLKLGNADEAKKKFLEAVDVHSRRSEGKASLYFSWGSVLSGMNLTEEATVYFEEAVRLSPQRGGIHYNLAYCRERQGRYEESWARWEEAHEKFKAGADRARNRYYADFFRDLGYVQRKLGKLEEAQKTYEAGLRIHANHTGILCGLVEAHLELEDSYLDSGDDSKLEAGTVSRAMAVNYFRRAEKLLLEEEAQNPDGAPFQQLAQLYLSMGNFGKAKDYVEKALKQDDDSAEEYNLQGVVFSRMELYKEAIDSFRKSLSLDPNELTTRSNLAEAYLNAKMLDRAEGEYQRVQKCAPNHVESLIGLGQVCLAMAEGGEKERYEEAIDYFERAIRLWRNRGSSVSSLAKKKKEAALHYSIAYAKVKLHQSSKLLKDTSMLAEALESIRKCKKLDRHHFKAIRAEKKIADELPSTTKRITEEAGPYIIAGASFLLLLATQWGFWRRGIIKETAAYISLTFGSLVMMVVGLYLPQILKLKVGGIELEKSTLNQFLTTETFEIGKQESPKGSAGLPGQLLRELGITDEPERTTPEPEKSINTSDDPSRQKNPN